MCLIIERNPKFELPYDKFETAITNNPDGYGLSYPDENGKLITLRSADTPDPEKLYRMINEDLITQKLMIHLRYTTVGETNLRNAHPFPVLEKAKDGVDLRMAHNGTLHKYKPKGTSDESDTRVFVREFVRPLFKRLARGMDPEELLNDDFTKKLLEDQLTTMSVLTFIDGEGNSLICNEEGNGGKREEGWYYSNKYSFNPKHRVTTTTPVTYYNSGTNYRNNYQGPKSAYSQKYGDCNVQKFTTKYSMKDITDIFCIEDDLIKKICKEHPDDAQLLVKELIYELQWANREIEILKNKKGTR